MNVEKAGLELQQIEMENLINIQIELSGSSCILKDVVQCDQRILIMDPLGLNKMNKKKWKRFKGKENIVPEGSGKLCFGADKVSKKR